MLLNSRTEKEEACAAAVPRDRRRIILNHDEVSIEKTLAHIFAPDVDLARVRMTYLFAARSVLISMTDRCPWT